MPKNPRRIRTALVLVALAAAAAWLSGPFWLSGMGGFLIQTDELEPADVIVVLAGDYSGRRVRTAVELLEDGLAPLALLNGAQRLFDMDECGLAAEHGAAYAAAHGVDAARLEPFCFLAGSTLEESRIVDAELVRRGLRRAIVVTSNFHTRRARMIFRAHTSGQVEYRFASAVTGGFNPDSWWRSRTGKKIVVVEYLKLLNSFLERAG